MEAINEAVQAALKNLRKGDRIAVKIISVNPRIGIFVTYADKIPGLIYKKEISWGIIKNLEEYKVGRILETEVLKIDKEKERISLGLKQLTKNPWDYIRNCCHDGKTISGTIIQSKLYGFWIEIVPGIEGMLHKDEIFGKRRSRKLRIGDEIEKLWILDFDAVAKKISFSTRKPAFVSNQQEIFQNENGPLLLF